jgi:hypothetical protein
MRAAGCKGSGGRANDEGDRSKERRSEAEIALGYLCELSGVGAKGYGVPEINKEEFRKRMKCRPG